MFSCFQVKTVSGQTYPDKLYRYCTKQVFYFRNHLGTQSVRGFRHAAVRTVSGTGDLLVKLFDLETKQNFFHMKASRVERLLGQAMHKAARRGDICIFWFYVSEQGRKDESRSKRKEMPTKA